MYFLFIVFMQQLRSNNSECWSHAQAPPAAHGGWEDGGF